MFTPTYLTEQRHGPSCKPKRRAGPYHENCLQTRESNALQTSRNDILPDEFVVRIQYQTQELWLECAAVEAANLVEQLDQGAVSGALAALGRIVLVTRLLKEQVRVLFTLSPSRFQLTRAGLTAAEGVESPGYDGLVAAAEAAWDALERMLVRRRATLFAIYLSPHHYPDLYRLLERFVDWHAGLQSGSPSIRFSSAERAEQTRRSGGSALSRRRRQVSV